MALRKFSLRIPRILTQNKAFSACVILSLGIGISCSASVLALVDAMLFGRTPYANIDRLEVPYVAGLPFGARSYALSAEVVRALMAPGSPLEEVALSRDASMNLRDGPRDESLHGMEVSPNYMRLMSQRMHIGRPIDESDANEQRQVVLSYRFWTSEYGSDSSVIGRVVSINERMHTVVGVARDERWIGLWTSNPLMLSTAGWQAKVRAIGLRKRDVEPGHARAMIATIGTSAMTTRTSPRERIEAQSLRARLTRSSRSSIIMLGSIAIGVALLTAVNFAGLVLARGIRRRSEIGVRAALGASVGRLAQHIVAESLALCALGGVLAAILAPSIGTALQTAFAGGIPDWIDFALSWRILAASVALSMLIGVVFALGPALDLARPALGGFLRSAGVGVSGSTGASRARAGVVSLQVALAACFLIILGGLIGRSLWLTKIDPGYDFEPMLSGGVDADSSHPGLWVNVRSRVEEIPGVVGASIVHARHLDSNVVAFEGADGNTATLPQEVYWWQTDETFHRLLRTRLVAGRLPTTEEQRSRAPVAVVTRVVAQRAFADNAVGRTVRLGLTRHTIVGVIERLEFAAYVDEPRAMVFTPVTAGVNRLTHTTLWVRAPNATMVWRTLREIRQRAENRALGARLHMGSIAEGMLLQTQFHRRIVTVVFTIFAVALGLAALGIYGLVSYTAEMRNREMAIREALGASRSRVAGLLLRGAFLQVAGGLVAGVLMANSFAWYMKAYRLELETLTRSTVAAIVLLLLTVLLSSLGPLRATWRRNLSHVLRD